jgi:hypothetical protein
MPVSRLNPLAAPARLLRHDYMSLLGVDRTTRIGQRWNARCFHDSLRGRRERVDEYLAELSREREAAGRRGGPTIELRDGWARDDSHSLPHLERLLEEMNAVIEQEGGKPHPFHGRPFLYDILPERGWETYGSILDFATLPEVLEPMARHAGFVPCLTSDTPPGVRLMESSTRFDPQHEGPWRVSQQWHTDFHFFPTIYVIVAVREIGPDDGALHFLPKSVSRRVAEAIGYNRRGVHHYQSDEKIEELFDPSELLTFTGPPGSVMLIDSSVCLHFGSRNPRNPRYQLQYAFGSPVRNDFGDFVRPVITYPVGDEDPLSRRLALDRAFG